MVLLERKGVSGWISKCSLVKSDDIPQGTFVHVCAYSMRVQVGIDFKKVWIVFGTYVCMYIVTVVPVQCWFLIYNPF